MHVVIIGSSIGYPIGVAATARMRCFAKGIISAGENVEIFNTLGISAEYTNTRVAAKGVHDGVSYTFCSGSSIRPKSNLSRVFEKYRGFFVSVATLVSRKIHGELDYLIVYSRNPRFLRKYAWLCKLLRVPIIQELGEWPEAIAATKGTTGNRAKRFTAAVLKYADAILPISHYIDEQICIKSGENKKPSLIVPVLFDGDYAQQNFEQEDYVLYTGSADYLDLAEIVLDTAREIKKTIPTFRMKITGFGKERNVKRFKDLIREYRLETNIQYLGYVDDDELARLVGSATALLAPLPESLQSIARAPTKIAYYMASGRPVVTSNTGEIKYYAKDGENAYVVSSECRAKDMAEKIVSIFADPSKANEVGENGRMYAINNFHYKVQGQRIVDFLRGIVRQ